ncbi:MULTISPECIES: hypothetical protein [Dysgonomonas]|uniref:hypothetical protein n=1 Tax=Dysgonomonas TaxID=156973 RepID=UPI000AE90EEA|nr:MULTISPECIES: hypothetical protein [Dysgonomonas]MBN9301637.1 hypothetical protein [Dysgonomonas mossii]
MTTSTLSIGINYLYATNHGVIEVKYIGPFTAMPGGDWHDFAINDRYKDKIITISATSIERGDLRCADLSITTVSTPSKIEANKDIPVSPVSSVQPDSVDLREIDIAFAKGGRSVTNNIKGTCLQNTVLHAYSYLYRAFVQGITDVRIYLHGKRIAIQDICSYTPVSFMDYLILNVKS